MNSNSRNLLYLTNNRHRLIHFLATTKITNSVHPHQILSQVKMTQQEVSYHVRTYQSIDAPAGVNLHPPQGSIDASEEEEAARPRSRARGAGPNPSRARQHLSGWSDQRRRRRRPARQRQIPPGRKRNPTPTSSVDASGSR
jgi:hypothetical protein